jgi:DNA primase
MPDVYTEVRSLPLLAVLSSLGFAEWKSRKEGTEWSGACPVCKPKTNRGNFSFAADGKFRCFSCPVKGRGAIDLVQAVKDCGFQEAVSLLRSIDTRSIQSRVQSPAAPHQEPRTVPTENPPFNGGQYHKYFVDSPWLAKRGFTRQTLEAFGVGEYFNPARTSAYKGKILIPVRRWNDGELVAYLARDPRPDAERGADPKYIWPKGFQKSLEVFGAWQLRQQRQAQGLGPIPRVFLVESPFAVMKFHQLGLPAVSCFGWSISSDQIAILAQLAKGVYFLPDRDKQKEAAQYAGLLAQSVWVKMPEYPAEDPESLSVPDIKSLA